MNEWEILQGIIDVFRNNPVLLGLLFGIIRNLGGYLYNGFKTGQWTYQKEQLFATLTLYETFFIGLQGIAGLSSSATVALTVAVDIVKSLKNAMEKS